MFIMLMIILIILGIFIYSITLFPKHNVMHHARREGINVDVWSKAQKMRNQCKKFGVFYPLNIPNFTLAHIASALTYYYRSRGNDETIVGAFVIPSDLDLLFNRTPNNSQYYDPSQPPQPKESHKNIGITAFIITSHSRLMFAHWEGKTLGASNGMYNLNPSQASCTSRRGLFSTSITINPNANIDEDAWGICYFPWANVATKVEGMFNSKLSQVNQKAIQTDENGRSVI